MVELAIVAIAALVLLPGCQKYDELVEKDQIVMQRWADLEANLQRDLVALVYGDVIFQGPGFLIGGEVLFKPDLGQFDRDLRGIKPYFGGGLGLQTPTPNFALTLDAGIEFALDRDTGLFIGGQSVFPFSGSPYGRVVLGASFR